MGFARSCHCIIRGPTQIFTYIFFEKYRRPWPVKSGYIGLEWPTSDALFPTLPVWGIRWLLHYRSIKLGHNMLVNIFFLLTSYCIHINMWQFAFHLFYQFTFNIIIERWVVPVNEKKTSMRRVAHLTKWAYEPWKTEKCREPSIRDWSTEVGREIEFKRIEFLRPFWLFDLEPQFWRSRSRNFSKLSYTFIARCHIYVKIAKLYH